MSDEAHSFNKANAKHNFSRHKVRQKIDKNNQQLPTAAQWFTVLRKFLELFSRHRRSEYFLAGSGQFNQQPISTQQSRHILTRGSESDVMAMGHVRRPPSFFGQSEASLQIEVTNHKCRLLPLEIHIFFFSG